MKKTFFRVDSELCTSCARRRETELEMENSHKNEALTCKLSVSPGTIEPQKKTYGKWNIYEETS